MSLLLFLDDVRPAPEGWVLVKTARACIEILRTEQVEQLSLDHDLGEVTNSPISGLTERYVPSPEDGSWVVRTMIQENLWPLLKPKVHSANPPAAERMRGLIDRYGPYGPDGRRKP